MLNHLARYAQQAGLAPEPGFATRRVHWAIHIDESAQLLKLENLETAGRPREFPRSPDLSQPELLGGGDSCPRSHFLLESARVLLDHLDAQEHDPDRTRLKRQHFQSTLSQLVAAVPQLAWLSAAHRFLDDSTQRELARQKLIAMRGSPGDLIVIVVQGRNPLEDISWHDWWRAYRKTLTPRSQPQARPARDLLTGQLVTPLSTHRRLKGLQSVGGHSSGDALVSFGQPAFESHGFQRAHNAPLSAESEAVYVLALNHLLARARQLEGTLLCAWTDPPRKSDPLPPLFGESQMEEEEEEEARFHLLMLSANHSRVLMRDHLEGNALQLRHALASWREDLSIVGPQGTLAPAPSIREVLASLRPQPGELPSTLAPDIVRAAVTQSPLPQTLLPLILNRIKADVANPQRNPFQPARIGLLKACLLRLGFHAPSQLMGNHPSPAYHCGRLLAALAKLVDHPGISAVQRSYHTASCAPAAILPRLLEQARMRKQAAPPNILGRLPSLPPRLDIEQQGLFALGYHHQRVWRTQGEPEPHREG